jgi:hypothetical protein
MFGGWGTDSQGQLHIAPSVLNRPASRLLRFGDPVLDGVLVQPQALGSAAAM